VVATDAPTSPQRLFCHVHGRGKGRAQLIPGWAYSFGVALKPGRTSWTALLHAVRLGPTDDTTTVTADQLRGVVERLITAGQWRAGDPDILIVTDAGYDITRLAFVLADLPIELLGRLRADWVLRLPTPPRLAAVTGRPPKHGPEFALSDSSTWPRRSTSRSPRPAATAPRPRPRPCPNGRSRPGQRGQRMVPACKIRSARSGQATTITGDDSAHVGERVLSHRGPGRGQLVLHAPAAGSQPSPSCRRTRLPHCADVERAGPPAAAGMAESSAR
jgi:hypothetical protein